MTVRSHNLPEVELNRTNSSPDMTNTYSAGNAYFNNQCRESIRQENNDKYNIETAQKYQEQSLRALPISITNTYTQWHII